MSATLYLAPDATNRRVLIVWAGASAGAELFRTDPQSPHGTPVRGGYDLPAQGSVYDYEAPQGEILEYDLRAADGALLATGATEWDLAGEAGALLVHPTIPALTRLITVFRDDRQEWDEPGRVYRLLDGRDVVVTGYRRGPHTGTLVFWTPPGTRLAVRALFADGSPLLVSPPASCNVDYEWVYGKLRLPEQPDPTGRTGLVWELDYTAVSAPAGAIVTNPGASWAAVEVEHATWTSVGTDHATWTDVLAATHPHPTP